MRKWWEGESEESRRQAERQRADRERYRSRLKIVNEQCYRLVCDVNSFIPRHLAEELVILRRELGEEWDCANQKWIPYTEEV